MSFLSDASMWANLFTGVVLLLAGFGVFILRVRWVNNDKRKKLMKALCAEIGRIRIASAVEIETLKLRIEAMKPPLP